MDPKPNGAGASAGPAPGHQHQHQDVAPGAGLLSQLLLCLGIEHELLQAAGQLAEQLTAADRPDQAARVIDGCMQLRDALTAAYDGALADLVQPPPAPPAAPAED